MPYCLTSLHIYKLTYNRVKSVRKSLVDFELVFIIPSSRLNNWINPVYGIVPGKFRSFI